MTIANRAADSSPSKLPGNRPIKKGTITARKPRTGTDWSTSTKGKTSRSATAERAVSEPTATAIVSEMARAINIRREERAA